MCCLDPAVSDVQDIRDGVKSVESGQPYGKSFPIERRPMRNPGDLLPSQYRVVTPRYFTCDRSFCGSPFRRSLAFRHRAE